MRINAKKNRQARKYESNFALPPRKHDEKYTLEISHTERKKRKEKNKQAAPHVYIVYACLCDIILTHSTYSSLNASFNAELLCFKMKLK